MIAAFATGYVPAAAGPLPPTPSPAPRGRGSTSPGRRSPAQFTLPAKRGGRALSGAGRGPRGAAGARAVIARERARASVPHLDAFERSRRISKEIKEIAGPC
jgi:hypothetical protein